MPKIYSEEIKKEAVELYKKGLSAPEVSKMISVIGSNTKEDW